MKLMSINQSIAGRILPVIKEKYFDSFWNVFVWLLVNYRLHQNYQPYTRFIVSDIMAIFMDIQQDQFIC